MANGFDKAMGLLACGVCLVAQAQAPVKNVTIVVPQPAGNPTDGVARKLQPLLQDMKNNLRNKRYA